jgi:hypothetical protein
MKKPKDESKAKGALALAKAMTPEQRKVRAKKGAIARWGTKPLQATHTGNFKNDFGIDVDCYVLNDENKMAVISKRGMGSALGYKGDGGSRLAGFINGKTISHYAGQELIEKLENPIVFQGVMPGTTSMVRSETHGYDVTILIDLCKVIIQAEADGKLSANQGNLAKQAHIILSASAKAGIQGLVYALAGYDRTKDEVIAAYKMYVMEEAREYEKEFSPELYEQWYRLYGLVKPERGRPWEFKYLTIDHIYKPLAKSNGKVFSLAKSSKQANGEKGDKIHQFLSEIGVKALRTQVGKITGIAIVSESRAQYEKYISEKVYGQKSLPFESEK